jgi:exonuclease SbcC
MEARLKKASQSAAEANTSLAAAREAHGKAGEENHRADGALGEAQKRFSEQRTAAGFASDEEYRAARLADAQVRELEESIARHDRALSAAHDRNGRAVLAAAGLTAPNLPALQLSLREAKYKLEQAIGQRKTLEHDLGQLDRCVEKLRTLAEQAAEYEKQYTVYGTLAEAALGKNDQGMAFQRFVLAFLLDDVLVAATARLKIMSRGRYQLQRQRERADRRGASGLELEVFDSFTGASRAVATLSGGEGFLASLSLALGLADVVQSYAGGIRMETVFIDEGFGSLDSESLDLAIRALEDLLRGGRLVGIISHVTELRERIAARLEVTGSQSGSSARFVVGTTAAEGMITRAAGRPRW